ncbi:DUF1223 domain-containing protein [Pseudooctadecabacter jejudonensis]|nr:DUF1223 domain-containing protein [Pseudooctadecabacter jejudonensis]
MRQILASLSVAITMMGAAPASAEGPVVIELYTSQGCSSCPPADALLHDLADRDDVIPLALHVDYWDYIGWADSFADPRHTVRQQGYAAAAGHNTIYTPQMVIAGQTHVIGAKPMQVADAIKAHQAPTGVAVDAAVAGGALTITGTTEQALPAGTTVQVVRFSARETVDIQRGENAGRTLEYANIVTDWQTVGEWSGADSLQLSIPVQGDAPIVVIVQQEGAANGPGAVLATAVLR